MRTRGRLENRRHVINGHAGPVQEGLLQNSRTNKGGTRRYGGQGDLELLNEDLSNWRVRLKRVMKCMNAIGRDMHDIRRDNANLRKVCKNRKISSTQKKITDTGTDPWLPNTSNKGTNTEETESITTIGKAGTLSLWATEMQKELRNLRCDMEEEKNKNSRWRKHLTERMGEERPHTEREEKRTVVEGKRAEKEARTEREALPQDAPKRERKSRGERGDKEKALITPDSTLDPKGKTEIRKEKWSRVVGRRERKEAAASGKPGTSGRDRMKKKEGTQPRCYRCLCPGHV
ncbi:uncharacterized protein LOC114933686 [Nylanderia fulva]|uniref:uncharacterized protein LOC114933686 n=1 Tax=Nylanderia fulva TaxID=613905 RepID=UPI0010FB295B|nr:uncharacterized protein LOC114933686 [Nylanderia fulva]